MFWQSDPSHERISRGKKRIGSTNGKLQFSAVMGPFFMGLFLLDRAQFGILGIRSRFDNPATVPYANRNAAHIGACSGNLAHIVDLFSRNACQHRFRRRPYRRLRRHDSGSNAEHARPGSLHGIRAMC